MKILFVAQRFYQGGGGAPESLRLMANQLSAQGLSFDLVDRGRFWSNIEQFAQLPTMDDAAGPFPQGRVGDYGAIVIAGPWQNPRHISRVLRERRSSQRLLYMPRGGLTKTEFSRARDIKKWPYLFLIERRLVSQCQTLVFSSDFERANTILPRSLVERGVVIPDLFTAAAVPSAVPSRAAGPVTFGFMAEITPLKGLLPLVEAFVALSEERGLRDRIRLIVAGGVRRGREAYFRKVQALQAANADIADVTFVGPVSHAKRAEFYGATDIFVTPSRSESYGLTVLESLAAGCATIVGPDVGVLEQLSPHDRLTIAASSDRDDIKAALLAQFERTESSAQCAREQTLAYAGSQINTINARAKASWMEIFK